MSDGRPSAQETRTSIVRDIRAALLDGEGATKAELSRRLGISFPTASKFVDLMEARGEVELAGLDESSGGRRARRYRYRPDFLLGLAIFLEKNETSYTVFDCEGTAVEQGSAGSLLEEDAASLVAIVERIKASHPRLRAVSIGVPGAVGDGRVFYIPAYEKYHLLDLKSFVEERTGIATVVENDMNAAVLGYLDRTKPEERGESYSKPSVVYLYLGQNGPGAGIVVNGEVVRGQSFFSGEVSFLPQYDGRSFMEALEDGTEEGVADAVGRLVAAMTAILNPHDVVFNRDEWKEAGLARVAERSAVYVPREHLPELVASDWRADYLAGLRRLGRDVLLTLDAQPEID